MYINTQLVTRFFDITISVNFQTEECEPIENNAYKPFVKTRLFPSARVSDTIATDKPL